MDPIPVFEPSMTLAQVIGFIFIYAGTGGIFVGWLHAVEDSFRKGMVKGLANTLLPLTIVGYPYTIFYAATEYRRPAYRLPLAGAMVLGWVLTIAGIYLSLQT